MLTYPKKEKKCELHIVIIYIEVIEYTRIY